MIDNWQSDKQQICDRIRSTQAVLKLLLKTRNDPYFLEEWILYHANIVGLENLVVADNGSDNAAVTEVYEKYRDRVTVFRFSGLHNDIHDPRMYPELFGALRDSCRYYQFVDTDERFVLLDGNRFFDGGGIVEQIDRRFEAPVVPGIWLSNRPESRTSFMLGPHVRLMNALQWGKSMLSPTLTSTMTGQLLHNCQLPFELLAEAGSPHVGILHLNSLSVEQRLNANREKLLSRRAINGDESFESIAEGTPKAGALPGSEYFFKEVRRLVEEKREGRTRAIDPRDVIELLPDKSYRFGSEATAEMFGRLFTDGQGVLNEAMERPADLKPK